MNIEKELEIIIRQTIKKLEYQEMIIELEIPKNKDFGDYSTNIAMKMAKIQKKNPIEIAETIKMQIEKNNIIKKIDIIKPGFINFHLNKNLFLNIINEILEEDENFGRSNIGQTQKINIEFASVNPTGKLHLGHARGSAYGDNLCRILSFCGYNITSEYYVNDSGKQIENLGNSIKERYRGLCSMEEKMPEDGYYGKEVIEIAKKIYDENNQEYIHIDNEYIKEKGVKILLNNIKTDLEKFRIKFDVWTSEKDIRAKGKIEESLSKLEELNITYEKEGALWLKATDLGDEKDRVLVKKDGEYTYLTPDIAYHLDKFERGYNELINVWGADHHGYIRRLKASLQALGYDQNKIDVRIVQMVRLLSGKEEIKMSKRTGNIYTLSDLMEEVGIDAARYFFGMRNINTQMDFDVELARSKTNENPYYYVGYAHARICTILKNVKEIKKCFEYETINSEYAYNMLAKLHEFKSVVEKSAIKRMPHLITDYLYELANLFHVYYNNEKIMVNNEKEANERMNLIKVVKIVIRNGLNLIGVESPEKM